MSYPNYQLARIMMDVRIAEAQYLIVRQRLGVQSGTQPRSALYPNRLLARLGQRMVVLGTRLEQYASVQAG